jgi:hypothetical protein
MEKATSPPNCKANTAPDDCEIARPTERYIKIQLSIIIKFSRSGGLRPPACPTHKNRGINPNYYRAGVVLAMTVAMIKTGEDRKAGK